MTDNKNYQTEWSLDFGKLGDRINRAIDSVAKEKGEVKTEHFETPVAGATHAAVTLDLSVGKVTITGGAADDKILEADVTFVGEMRWEVSGDGDDKRVFLGHKTDVVTGIASGLKQLIGTASKTDNLPELQWTVRLNNRLPLTLRVDTGVGEVTLDLTGVNVRAFVVDGGVGENTIRLPDTGALYSGKVEIGVGKTVLIVPDGAALDLSAKGGVGALHTRVGKDVMGSWTLEGGIGLMEFELAADLPVQVVGATGLGGITLPASFRRVAGGEGVGAGGTWETEAYKLAQRRLSLRYQGGIGALVVK